MEYLKGYALRKYDNAKLLEKILTDFEEEELIEPANPDDTPAGLFRWQLKMKEYYKDTSNLEKLKFAVWALIWGQCTEIVRKKLKALTDLQEKEKVRDLAWLLRNLRKICSKIDDTKHPFITLYEMRKNLLLYRQQDDQTIAEYADELQSVYKTLHSIDGDLVPL